MWAAAATAPDGLFEAGFNSGMLVLFCDLPAHPQSSVRRTDSRCPSQLRSFPQIHSMREAMIPGKRPWPFAYRLGGGGVDRSRSRGGGAAVSYERGTPVFRLELPPVVQLKA